MVAGQSWGLLRPGGHSSVGFNAGKLFVGCAAVAGARVRGARSMASAAPPTHPGLARARGTCGLCSRLRRGRREQPPMDARGARPDPPLLARRPALPSSEISARRSRGAGATARGWPGLRPECLGTRDRTGAGKSPGNPTDFADTRVL